MGALPLRLHMSPTGAVILLLLAGCGPHKPESTMPVTVVTAVPQATASTTSATYAVPTAIASPMPPTPTPTPTLPEMRPRKTFVDPPLPPELLDDGGLRPLPPSKPPVR